LMRVRVTEAALVRGESPACGLAAVCELRRRVTADAWLVDMRAGQRPRRLRGVIEGWDLEALRRVTAIALEDGLLETELSEVDVVVTAGAVARDAAIAGATIGGLVLAGPAVAALASGRCVRAGERPCRVIDLR